MRFKEFPAELLDRKVEYTVDRASSAQFQTSAMIGDRKIKFSAWANPPTEEGVWEVLFSESGKGASNTFGATGSGSELEVFSMVKDSMLELISRYQPSSITFTADKEGNSRSSVYDRLLKRFKVPGYKHQTTSSKTHDEFVIARDDA